MQDTRSAGSGAMKSTFQDTILISEMGRDGCSYSGLQPEPSGENALGRKSRIVPVPQELASLSEVLDVEILRAHERLKGDVVPLSFTDMPLYRERASI